MMSKHIKKELEQNHTNIERLDENEITKVENEITLDRVIEECYIIFANFLEHADIINMALLNKQFKKLCNDEKGGLKIYHSKISLKKDNIIFYEDNAQYDDNAEIATKFKINTFKMPPPPIAISKLKTLTIDLLGFEREFTCTWRCYSEVLRGDPLGGDPRLRRNHPMIHMHLVKKLFRRLFNVLKVILSGTESLEKIKLRMPMVLVGFLESVLCKCVKKAFENVAPEIAQNLCSVEFIYDLSEGYQEEYYNILSLDDFLEVGVFQRIPFRISDFLEEKIENPCQEVLMNNMKVYIVAEGSTWDEFEESVNESLANVYREFGNQRDIGDILNMDFSDTDDIGDIDDNN